MGHAEDNYSEVLALASRAGHILLENGAEISRIEDIMTRIATHYGVDSGNFFVLSNGIFTTGTSRQLHRRGKQASSYANVEFIPIHAVQFSKLVEVNRLSYAIAADELSLSEARRRLDEIASAPGKANLEVMLGYALGAGGFAAIFGGGYLDSLAAATIGILTWLFIHFVSSRHMSKIVSGISNALIVTLLSLVFYRVGFGTTLGDIIIGGLMPLIPGVPFVNGIRDLADSDYLAGITRMADALLSFVCISLGVSLGLMLDGAWHGGLIPLTGMAVNAETAGYLIQALAAFLGTLGFAILYGLPRRQYLAAAVIGTLGWLVYLLGVRTWGMTPAVATLLSTFTIGIMARAAAVMQKVPSTVFLICGIFCVVPGAGIFWSTYYTVSSQIQLASSTGFTALKVALCIVLGIVFAMELPQWLFSRRRRSSAIRDTGMTPSEYRKEG